MKAYGFAALIAVALSLAACQKADQPKLVLSTKAPVELRAMQSRAFDTTDGNRILRAVLSTLQDLGYSIDKVDVGAGTVSATKLANLRLTASTYPRGGSNQIIVRANAIYKLPGQDTQVDDPVFYQTLFFEPLSKAMFLSALQVEDVAEPSNPPTKRN